MKGSASRSSSPASVMVWSLPDAVIEDWNLLERQFRDLRQADFDGVAPFVRCSRYTWHDLPARRALRWIGEACAREGITCWIVPDPRLVSRQLIGEIGGLEVLLFGDAARAHSFPHMEPVKDGRFRVRCALPPRHVHMLTEVAVEYVPQRLARVYAVRNSARALGPADVVDITSSSRLFYNARDRYVEAFGTFETSEEGEWSVLVFFQARTNHVDFSSREQMEAYHRLLTSLARSGVQTDGILWDEPGFTCTYGTLPYSPSHRREYRRATGRALAEELWKLVLEAEDGSHVRVRTSFYRTIRESIVRAQKGSFRRARSLWGRSVVSGMHDTWHFESADMCDMNHGSLDLWQGLASKSGGFVDLGGINALRDRSSPWYAHLAAVSVIAASLGKFSRDGCAYNNLWTVGDDAGEGWQREVMDHSVSIMGLFGTRWLAHAYGPVGTIGEEDSFLGSPPLPGYPAHSTWEGFPVWNRRLRDHCLAVEHRLPWSNLLLLYPVESMYALADPRADGAARSIFQLILELLDAHYHVDVLSPELCAAGRWGRRGFRLGNRTYDAVVFPHARVLPIHHLGLVRGAGGRLLFAFERPLMTTAGIPVRLPEYRFAPRLEDMLALLDSMDELRPVTAPLHSWVTCTETREGVVISLAPARSGQEYGGRLLYRGIPFELGVSALLRRVLYPRKGAPRPV